MALDPEVDDLDKVPEGDRKHYVEADEVDSEGKATGKTLYRLDFGDADVVAAFGGKLKRAHKRTAEELRTAKAALAAERAKTDNWEKVGTELGLAPGDVRGLYDERETYRGAAATHQASVKEIEAKHEKVLRAEKAATAAEHQKLLDNLTKTRSLGALGNGNRHTALPGILARMKTADDPAGGKPVTTIELLAGDDEVFLSEDDRKAGKELPEFKDAGELVAAMRQTEAFGGCWPSDALGGSGAGGDGAGDPGGGAARFSLTQDQAKDVPTYRRVSAEAEKAGESVTILPN